MAGMPAKPPPWKRPNPKAKPTPLTDAQKARARARAEAAGRRYPNLVDNMAIAKEVREAKAKRAARRPAPKKK